MIEHDVKNQVRYIIVKEFFGELVKPALIPRIHDHLLYKCGIFYEHELIESILTEYYR